MAFDSTAESTDGLAPALRVIGNRHRLEILRLLDGGASSVNGIAGRLGVPARAVSRHLAALEDWGLVRPDVSSGNGRLYSLDRQKVAILNASFISLMGRVGSADAPQARTDSSTSAIEILPTTVPRTPDACMRCQNASFVREVLDELDRSLVEARRHQARLRQMSSQVLTAQEEERKRIAREMHDDTAQALTSVLVRLRLLERSAADEGLRGGLAELRDLTGDALEGVRRMAADLRPPMLDDLGLETALRSHVQDFSRRSGVEATFTVGRLGRLTPEIELVLYRIVQESLSNAGRHAGASQVLVRLRRSGRVLRLLVEDDGRGFDVEAVSRSRGSGLGLFGMAERLALVGGRLRVESDGGKGTRVFAEVPLPRGRRR